MHQNVANSQSDAKQSLPFGTIDARVSYKMYNFLTINPDSRNCLFQNISICIGVGSAEWIRNKGLVT